MQRTLSRMSRMSRRPNLLLQTDVYKMGHIEQYIPGCTQVYSYMQARSDRTYPETIFFGLQYYLKEHLSKPITHEDVDEFISVKDTILGTKTSPETEGKLRKLADLGYLPIEIKAVPEGTVMPVRNVLMTMTNTHPDFYWTVGFVESLILKLWYPITVSTTSLQYRKIVDTYFNETVDESMHFLKPFMVHDFGYRGDPSEEGAVISGLSHLLTFTGSDTVPAFKGAVDYYNADPKTETIMASVPASEHSVMCSFGKDGELDAYKHMLKTYPTGLVSIVSDTYDIWNVLTNLAAKLKDQILARDGKVVFRPDSGNPEYIICGNPDADPSTPEGKGCIRLLDEMFGSTVNNKGYKVLNPKVGLIYGDGMFLERYQRTLERMKQMGYASSNLVIGVGGILRYHTRDTLSFAIKATKVTVNGKEMSIMKDPITDKKKVSHLGYVSLIKENGQYKTLNDVSKEQEEKGLLVPVFRNGKILHETSLKAIRDRVSEMS